MLLIITSSILRNHYIISITNHYIINITNHYIINVNFYAPQIVTYSYMYKVPSQQNLLAFSDFNTMVVYRLIDAIITLIWVAVCSIISNVC